MTSLPVMFNLAGRLVVIVGGGPVGVRKARAMLEAGASVTMVSPGIVAVDGFDPSARQSGMTVLRQQYEKHILAGATLVFACTDDRAVNARIAADARAAGAFVNTADQPEDCDFYMPAIIRDGPVVVAVGTAGAAPGLSAFLAEKLRPALPERIGLFAQLLAELRAQLKDSVPNQSHRMAVVKRLSDQATFDLFLSAGPTGVRHKLQQMLQSP